ncbi:MAG: urease accessory protein UreD [Opitutae bacterium]|nr:urease accessory protein UreD [Opitutae bacterium]
MAAISTDPVSARPAVHGGARLGYTYRSDVGTRLTEQWVRPPLHLAKAYHENDWAISILTSPTAGLLDGDRLEVTATVASGAKAALISPAACRVHTMGSGHAEVDQHYTVEAGAVLDVWPAPLILQKEAALRQTTRLDVAVDATVLLCEVVSPGRAAFGEAFEFTEWTSKLRIYREGVLLAYENFTCKPVDGDLADWRELYPEGNYASLYYLSPQPLGEIVQTLHDCEIEDATIGASLLREGGIGVKVLAKDGIGLRKAIFEVRSLLIAHSDVEFPHALKRAQTFFH